MVQVELVDDRGYVVSKLAKKGSNKKYFYSRSYDNSIDKAHKAASDYYASIKALEDYTVTMDKINDILAYGYRVYDKFFSISVYGNKDDALTEATRYSEDIKFKSAFDVFRNLMSLDTEKLKIEAKYHIAAPVSRETLLKLAWRYCYDGKLDDQFDYVFEILTEEARLKSNSRRSEFKVVR